ncbi:MAG: PspA/IM30 family protein, partial [Oscillospiraceae bacterium]
KADTAGVIADEMAAGRKVGDLEEETVKLSKYAEQAVVSGNDSDAKKFLEGKNKAAAQKAEAEKVYAQAKVNSDRMREMTQKLVGDITTAENRLNELKAKLSVAQQTEKTNELNEKIGNAASSFSNYDNLADAVQKRIDEADAKAQLNKELNADYDIDSLKAKYDVSADAAASSVDDELNALKAKLGK